MIFQKYPIPNHRREKLSEWTPRREAAAKRAVRRELDAVPLFPELARLHTVDDRKAQIDAFHIEFAIFHRNSRAASWKEARQKLRALPPITKAGVIKYWGVYFGPKDPSYLLEIIRKCQTQSPWTILRERAQLKTKGAAWRKLNGWT